jgi:hypothetical protein
MRRTRSLVESEAPFLIQSGLPKDRIVAGLFLAHPSLQQAIFLKKGPGADDLQRSVTDVEDCRKGAGSMNHSDQRDQAIQADQEQTDHHCDGYPNSAIFTPMPNGYHSKKVTGE